MNRESVIGKVMSKLSMLDLTSKHSKLLEKIKDGTVPEASIPRYIFSFAEKRRYNDDQRLKLMQDMLEAKIQNISPRHKQSMLYLRDKLFKIPKETLDI